MSIEGIVLITSVEFTAPKDLELKVDNESKNVVPEKKSPDDVVNGTPDGLKHYTDGTIIFVIDVHCRVPGAEKLQLQGGVVVYRHLLNLFKEKQEKLKVIFYSPLSKDLLVKLRPENYILKLLPFVECNYDGASNFENALSGQIAECEPAKWPRFNNASENLLSGWAIVNEKMIRSGEDEEVKIPLNGRKLLIVDDEYSCWTLTYQSILNLPIAKFPTKKDFQDAWRTGNAPKAILEKAANFDAVVSDLYIEENHEDTNPYKLLSDLERISGYKLFNAIKTKYPYLPYMMFTSSNKVWNADAFRSEGVWAWAVKDTSIYVSGDNKRAQFDHFSDCISKLVNPECRFLAEVWKRLLELKGEAPEKFWWHGKDSQALRILEECLFILDTVYSQRSAFETNKVDAFEGRLCSVVLNNLGGLCEELGINPDSERQFVCLVASYVWRIRSVYSHGLSYQRANRIEVLFCADLMIGLFKLTRDEFNSLDVYQRIWKDDGRPINANINYFRQFEGLRQYWGVTYVEILFDCLKRRFSEVTENVISEQFVANLLREEEKLRTDQKRISNLRKKVNGLRQALKMSSS